MNRSIKSLLVALGLAMLFSALSVGVVFAEGGGDGDDSSDTTEETRESRGEAFREDLAEALGVTVEELETAFKQVALDRVNAAEEAGTITEEQAESARTKIESGEWGDKRRGGHRFGRGGSLDGETLDERKAQWKQAALDRIDAAVEAGTISEEKAEELKSAIESGEKPDRDGRSGGRRGFGKGGGWSHEKGTDETATTE